MVIISSQRYVNYDKVDELIKDLISTNQTVVRLPVWNAGEIEGVHYGVLNDGHHRLVAARELNLNIEYVVGPHPEGLTGTALLDAFWIDSDWYDVETGRNIWA